MTTFGIDGIRIDPAGHITHVRWAPIDPKTHDWLSPTRIVEVGDVVKAIRAGEVCWSIFTLGGKRFLGPGIRVVAHINGPDGIDTDVPGGSIEKCMDDLAPV
ncbi:hypothetical protein [Paraburkholderia sp. RL17-337-BIB-A]|jgi:hypothetical protein|uniref:hypothetical protein n=1 Tax=Paraburkholderia sp. RL17-337-BIB-A TaxID=3031636 RepID=UPI0038BB633F